MIIDKCPKCEKGFLEEQEDYSNETHIARCSKCFSEFWINYKRVYKLNEIQENLSWSIFYFQIGDMEEQDWEFSHDEAEIYSEELDNVVNLNAERNRRIENDKA